MRLGDQGTVIGLAVGGEPDLQRFDARYQLLDQRVGGCFAHRHRDRDGHAALAGRAVARTDQRIDGAVHVGIRHDDHVVLGAAEALHALSVRGSA